MTKRKLEDVDVSEIDSPFENVTVHGVVSSLSPAKVSRQNDKKRYFHANITDGKKAIRVVSFEPSLRPEMDKSCTHQKPIAVVNCQVKETPQQYQSGSSQDSKYELLLSTRSGIRAYQKKFAVEKRSESETVQTVALEDLPIISVNQTLLLSLNIRYKNF